MMLNDILQCFFYKLQKLNIMDNIKSCAVVIHSIKYMLISELLLHDEFLAIFLTYAPFHEKIFS